jgi:hypothetical protein
MHGRVPSFVFLILQNSIFSTFVQLHKRRDASEKKTRIATGALWRLEGMECKLCCSQSDSPKQKKTKEFY